MTPTWRALIVSGESTKAHLWEPPNEDGELRSWCGLHQGQFGLMLELEQGERRRCGLCERALRRNREAG